MAPLFLLSTASLYFDSLPSGFRLVREAALDGVELSITPANGWLTPQRIQALAEQAGLQVASVHPPTVPLPGWGRNPASRRRLAALARALPGCRIVVLHTPPSFRSGDRPMERFRHTLATFQEALAGSPIVVALENRNRRPGEPLGLLDDPAALLDTARREGCGIVLDTAHASTLPWPLLETYRAVRERLANIHLSDVVSMGWWDRFSYPRSILGHHRIPGQGGLPLRALLAELGQSGYSGLITLELSPVALRFWSRPATRRLLRETAQNCRQWLGNPEPRR
jgi:sugar phosphate isomerase/epimerase